MPCRSPAMPRTCLSESYLSRPRQGRSRKTAWYVWISIGRPEMACGRPARVRFLPPTTRSSRKVVIYQKHTNLRCRWPVLIKATFVMDEENLIILMQGHQFSYNLQHKDYDNSLVKDNCWKEIAGEWHGMCELAFNAAWEWHCICESA
jgi:hypothetical protein